MVNSQLETFITAAEAGSFSKAAEQLFVTPTAVNKQMNLLEANLGLQLFERSHQGLVLTEAGESFYKDCRYILQYCKDSLLRAQNAASQKSQVIRIGSSPITPAQALTNLWPKINEICPDIRFQVVLFENTLENSREIMANFGKNIDVMAGIFDDTLLDLRKCAGFEIRRVPLCCAVSVRHPLAAKERLTVQDLYGQNLLLMHRDWSHYVDRLRDDLWKNHPQVNIVDFDCYHVSVFNRCETTNDVLLAVREWAGVHPLLKILPVEWDYTIPYGLLHAPKPSRTMKRFLDAVQTVLQK